MTTPEFKVTESDLASYLGRSVKLMVTGEKHPRVGFIDAIRDGLVIFVDADPVSLVEVTAAYNIASKKIAGDGPDTYIRY
jgi:hypothetical protein